ncbi:MAG: hypothetical protein HYU66_15115 [Armatimonadetes bacterium]|nr:hypothetical protein [Armatimonadota bacterium]
MLTTLVLLAGLNAANLAPNADLEQVADGWFPGWSRGWARDGAAAFAGEMSADRPHSGARCLHFRHTGKQDWAVQPGAPLAVKPGDIFDLSVWLRVPGDGHVVLCASVHPPGTGEQGVEWAAAAVVANGPWGEWRQLKTTLCISDGKERALPRLIGDGPVEAFVDDFVIEPRGNIADLRRAYSGPATATLTAPGLSLEVTAVDLGLAVTDRRTGRRWQAAGSPSVVPVSAERAGEALRLTARQVTSGQMELRFELGQ